MTISLIDIFQIHKDSSVQCCFIQRNDDQSTLLQLLSIIGNFFKSILLLLPGSCWVLGQSDGRAQIFKRTPVLQTHA